MSVRYRQMVVRTALTSVRRVYAPKKQMGIIPEDRLATPVAFSSASAPTNGKAIRHEAATLFQILGFNPRRKNGRPLSLKTATPYFQMTNGSVAFRDLPEEEKERRRLKELKDRQHLQGCWDTSHCLGQSSDQDVGLHPVAMRQAV